MSVREFWINYLDSPTLSVLPHDFLKPANNQSVEASHQFKAEGKFITGLAVFAALIYRLTGDDDILIATDTDTGKEFIIRVNVLPTMTFKELEALVTKEYEQNFSKLDSLDEIALDIKNKKKLDDLPGLFKLSYQHSTENDQLLTSVEGSIRDLAVYVGQSGKLGIHYNSLLYKNERILILAEQYTKFLKAVTENADSVITSVSLLTPSQLDTLPDPTKDLDWSGYRGAIQDIFMENALKHPDSTCVVETKSFMDPKSKTRTFNYKQINQASNVVGNYLKETGIKKGDIVMIYAYRGVDLMVAVMGVLKAGATFSVIDPAYPPARQNIYLQVSKPKGLIVLKKAGILDDLVENYIKEELEVVSSVRGLKLNDDGEIEADNSTSLVSYQKYKDIPTGVVVGPDSNPTLSFTSGSEGIPKGVLGRHFSLAYYFPWMSEKFNLSSKDKFTMLSGIAHDPIQRDMFTPLFLGAQLLIPTADDIGTPGKLADWMSEYGATVTHLTPAMGQLLSAQATTPIPTLHHAFFVGDILTKRDCLRLQTLAKNVYIVNMYGTTETQRSVSYFEITSSNDDPTYLKNLKDVMPAGSGMKNVQLLVVNRNERSQTCGVGEVGEIYVRAAGMAEGYRGLPDLNKEKFVTNWFVTKPWENKYDGEWLGPRDRLYRTGDLGRYLPDGNVECCGRADDQVKIRGFRIELGEIDTHLSQHPSVRENVTLVRRDKNEEPILISYIVPKEKISYSSNESSDPIVEGLVLLDDLVKDIKAYLRKRLASYAVPTIIVPLSKLPLNPNGKVDKPKLPFPDTAQLEEVAKRMGAKHGGSSNSAEDKLNKFESEIKEMWLEVLPNRPATISKSDSFFDLGGHSILATRMIFEIRKKLLVDVALGAIFKNPTLEGFAKEVEAAIKGEGLAGLAGENENNDGAEAEKEAAVDYEADAKKLIESLPESYEASTSSINNKETVNVFLTGATGFLGSFLVRDLLNRPNVKVYCHVRASSKEAGLERLKTTGLTYGIWQEKWVSSIEVVLGDLSKPKFGLPEAEWDQLTSQIDVIIHNGAFVHWVYPYAQLRDANVIGTLNVMSLCESGKAKKFSFVSSTSALDTDHFVRLSDELISEGKPGIPESDDLSGSAKGLGTGYGQSKWAAEHIIRAAGTRGLTGCVIRPGYVTGFSETGSSNTDDFLLRMLKGCAELGVYPDIENFVNMVPVDHVAKVVVSCAFFPPSSKELAVAHVTGHPRIRFNDFLKTLQTYGYNVKRANYPEWRSSLEKFVVETSDSALFPLLHFVLDNLPQDTKAPELDDANAVKSLKQDSKAFGAEDFSAGRGVDAKQMGIYLSYLIQTGFLPTPSGKGEEKLPEIHLDAETLRLVTSGAGGRGSAAK
ncbi:L-2-aminoadipate reductase [[Candida] railenensis]|uniref:Alpha-aminoadipate reductase n=1 Tax=[Candida] railenensis TaxID=45579 RepID=A0A9P0VYM6_9ASCO|nr:L-2-aminoadipate reductase [[Candida] railenensis]